MIPLFTKTYSIASYYLLSLSLFDFFFSIQDFDYLSLELFGYSKKCVVRVFINLFLIYLSI